MRIALRLCFCSASEVVVLASGCDDCKTRYQAVLQLEHLKCRDRQRGVGIEHDEAITEDAADLVIGVLVPVAPDVSAGQILLPAIPLDSVFLFSGQYGD